jgi:long-chain fatty acid transport protein
MPLRSKAEKGRWAKTNLPADGRSGRRFACSDGLRVSNYNENFVSARATIMLNQYKSSKLKLLLFGFMVWSARNVKANGFGLPDQDAFATARGEAFVATADNASAIYYNPAGIAQLAGNNLRGGIDSVYYEPNYQPPGGKPNTGQTYYSSDNFAFLPQLYYAYTAKDAPYSFGLGIYAPYGGKMNWPQNTGFRSLAISGSLKYITINPVVAVKLLPSLAVAAGAMANYGKIDMYQGLLPLAPRRVNYFNFAGDGWSFGYNAGILWQPLTQLSFGATFRSSARLNFQGNTDFELNPGPYNSPAQRDASAQFTFPLTTVFGVSYRPTHKWNIEADANYTDWSSFGTVTIEQSPPTVSNPFNQKIPVNLDWQASWMYELGATRYFDNGWHVSGGYVFNQNSVPNRYYTPLAADLDRNFLSLGIGYNGKCFNFDIAYQAGFAFSHNVTGSNPSINAINGTNPGNADGTYGFSSQAIFVSAGLHF